MPCCRAIDITTPASSRTAANPLAVLRAIEEDFCRPAIAVKAYSRRQPHAIDDYTVRLVPSPVWQPAAMEGVI
jgi:hypothetical protein